jgi:hypothetical protein
MLCIFSLQTYVAQGTLQLFKPVAEIPALKELSLMVGRFILSGLKAELVVLVRNEIQASLCT